MVHCTTLMRCSTNGLQCEGIKGCPHVQPVSSTTHEDLLQNAISKYVKKLLEGIDY